METPNNDSRNCQHPNLDWKQFLFPRSQDIASPSFVRLPNGPFGGSRLANSKELVALVDNATKNPGQYIKLFEAYAVAHDPEATVVDVGGLPIPLGKVAPNAIAVGRSGSGKTQTFTLAAAMDATRKGLSFVYFNIKGKRQTRLIRQWAKQFGRKDEVRVLAPQKPNRSCGWTALRGCQDLSVAGEVALCLVASAAGESRYGEGAWAYNQAQELIQQGVAAICADLPPDRHNLVELRRVVLAGDYKAFAETHPSFPALSKFARYVESSNHNGDTVAATISEATAFVDDIGACLSADELDIAEFAREAGILILEIDEFDVERLRSFSTLFLGRLIAALQRAACEAPSGSLQHKTLIIIDELAAAGPVPGIWNALHTCRERGFNFVAGVQSITQLPAIYGSKGEVVLEGFQSQIALGGGLDVASAEYFSRKSGTASILVPSVMEQCDEEGGGLETAQHWQIAARPLLLPSDIASPSPNPILGPPATIFLGDGATPPFLAYLTPAHELGHLARMMEGIDQQVEDDDLRLEPLKAPDLRATSYGTALSAAGPAGRPNFTDVREWSEEQIVSKLCEVKKTIDWENTTGSSRSWWEAFENENSTRLALVLRLAEELANRNATITEFFMAYVYSGSDNIQANLFYLDYRRLKNEGD